MDKNKKSLIIGMLIFMAIFLAFVVYYETNNIEVETVTYYVNRDVRDRLEIEHYKILEIVKQR